MRDPVVKKKKRDEAKNLWVFPSFFGAAPPTLANYLGLPIEIAERLAREFWRAFPGVRSWHTHIRRTYEEFGYVSSLAGYLRRAPIGATELINAPIQADEAKIVLDALIRLSRLDYKRYQPCMLIHDDLTFIIPKHEIEKRAEVIVETMLACPFSWTKVVPLTVEMSVGEDWENKKAVEVYSNA
jgi:DNA polymerase I-like protein with 3'-5' exonuclease and polymerase domains